MWNKNERSGKVDQAKGKVKQVVGTLAGDNRLKDNRDDLNRYGPRGGDPYVR
jgi:hypothetical protein